MNQYSQQNHSSNSESDSFYGHPDLPRISSAFIADLAGVPENAHAHFKIPPLSEFIARIMYNAKLPGDKQIIKALLLLKQANETNTGKKFIRSFSGAGAGQHLFAAAYMVAIGEEKTCGERWDSIWGGTFAFPEIAATAERIKMSLDNNSYFGQRIFDFKDELFRRYGRH